MRPPEGELKGRRGYGGQTCCNHAALTPHTHTDRVRSQVEEPQSTKMSIPEQS